jgi:hypothetical protein
MYQAYSDPSLLVGDKRAQRSVSPRPPPSVPGATAVVEEKKETPQLGHHRVVSGTLSAKHGKGVLEGESEEANRELLQALRGNILESIQMVC